MGIDRREFLFCNDLRSTGRGAVRLARLLWEQEVAGSNPVAPIFARRQAGKKRAEERRK